MAKGTKTLTPVEARPTGLSDSTGSIVLTIKVGRHSYDITSRDRFLDNGVCIQLLTQAKQRAQWGHYVTPLLSKRAVKEVMTHPIKYVRHTYGESCRVFYVSNKVDMASGSK